MTTTTATVLTPATRRRHRPPGPGARARVAGVLTAAVTVLLLSACGAGRNAETSREVAAIPGVNANAGPIGLRDLLVPYREGGYPAGGDVPLVVRLFSTAEQPVTVTPAVAGADASMTVPAQRIVLRQSGTAVAGRHQSATSLVVPAEGYLLLVPGSGPYLLAEHITTPLQYGDSIPVRFTFSSGGSVVVDVPMAPPTYPVSGSPAPRVTSPPTGTSQT